MWSACAVLSAVLLLQAPAADVAAEGLKALEEQRWQAAVDSFTKAVATDPKNHALRFNLAFALSMTGREPEAIAEYRRTLELSPGLYEAELNLGILLLNAKQFGEAAALLSRAVERKPKEFRPVWYLAETLLAEGQSGKAIPYFETALALQPDSKEALLGLARAMGREGRLADADPKFRKAAESSPEVLLELAFLYEKAGKTEEAASLYGKFPNDSAARERTGEILLEGGKAAEAIPHLEASVKQSPTPANRYALATAYNLTKQYDKAEPLLSEAVSGEPANADLRMMYARVLRQQRKYSPAAQEFAKVAQARPNSAEVWGDLAGMLILLEDYPQAIAALDRVKALGAEKPAHHYFRAIVLDKNKLLEPALASYETFLATSEGKNPDEEFKARQRVRIIKRELGKR